MQLFQIFAREKEQADDESRRPLHIDTPGGKTKVYLNRNGLIPVVVQDAQTGVVLRLGYMDAWALELSLKNRILFLYKRSRQRVVRLGEKDNLEYPIQEMWLDRNKRALLVRVQLPEGDTGNTAFRKRLLAPAKGDDVSE
ncbi:MAG: hypothetical protein GXO78_00340 [Calditrichaeota bacterium]|nr:hypothetical protein [Calditrichota bacterium]